MHSAWYNYVIQPFQVILWSGRFSNCMWAGSFCHVIIHFVLNKSGEGGGPETIPALLYMEVFVCMCMYNYQKCHICTSLCKFRVQICTLGTLYCIHFVAKVFLAVIL